VATFDVKSTLLNNVATFLKLPHGFCKVLNQKMAAGRTASSLSLPFILAACLHHAFAGTASYAPTSLSSAKFPAFSFCRASPGLHLRQTSARISRKPAALSLGKMQLDKADVSGLEEVLRQEVWPSENAPALDRAYEVRYSDSWEQGEKGTICS
jgi:hypothetical protein